MPRVRIGISGWRYAPWRGEFYPEGLPQRQELAFAAERLSSIEINGSFYALQRPESFRRWHAETPDDFVFAVKGGRFITHMKKLAGVEAPLANFFASGVLALGAKLGPLLWQLPPNLGFDAARLAAFFELLPRTTAGPRRSWRAPRRASRRPRLDGDRRRPPAAARGRGAAPDVRGARVPRAAARARRRRSSWRTRPGAGRPRRRTSDFVYVRLHGADELYVSGYDRRGARALGRRACAAGATDGLDVFVYFDNDVKVRAPFDAMRLAERVS